VKRRAVELGDVVESAEPGFASGDSVASGVVQLRMNNVGTDGALDWSRLRRVPADARKVGRYSLRPGDIAFNSTNSPELVGKTVLFSGHGEPVLFSNHFLRIRVDRSAADPAFVARWLGHLWVRRQFECMCVRWVNQATVRREDLLGLQLELPPLPEQRRIAALLDRADRLRRTRRYAIELSDSFLPAAFLEMFGDPQHWVGPQMQLQEAADILTGYPFPSDGYMGTGDTLRLCRGTNVLPDRVDWSDLALWPKANASTLSKFALECGDILIAMDRPWIGEGLKTAQVRPEDCPSLLVQRVARLRGRNGMPNEFLYHLLRQPGFTRHLRWTPSQGPPATIS